MKKPSLPDLRHIRKWPLWVGRFLSDNWWPIMATVLVIGSISTLLGTELLGLTRHYLSDGEQVFHAHLVNNDLGLRAILQNPVNLPYSLGIYFLEKLHIADALAIRGLSALFGAAFIFSFYLVLKNWHTRRVAILGTVLFATSAWTLHISRLATPEVLLMAPAILILCATWLEVSIKRRWTLVLCLVTALLLAYVPGMIFFVAAGIAWQAKRIYRELRQTPLWFVIPWAILGILLLLPLLWVTITAPHNLLALLGLPDKLPTIKQFATNLGEIPVQLVARGPNDASRWLGRLPILDVFSLAMAAIGMYAYAFRFKLARTKLLVGIFIAGSLLIALGGGVTITFLVPFVYIVIAGGITLMLQQWKTVFPRNPFARTLATTLMSIMVALVAYYNINHYFIAWPNTPATRQAFHQK
jgi:hypothetical protein